MVVSRTIFTRLKFILPEQKKGYQLKVTLIGITHSSALLFPGLYSVQGDLSRQTGRKGAPVLGAAPDHFSTSTGDQGPLQAGRKREGKLWGEPQEAA